MVRADTEGDGIGQTVVRASGRASPARHRHSTGITLSNVRHKRYDGRAFKGGVILYVILAARPPHAVIMISWDGGGVVKLFSAFMSGLEDDSTGQRSMTIGAVFYVPIGLQGVEASCAYSTYLRSAGARRSWPKSPQPSSVQRVRTTLIGLAE